MVNNKFHFNCQDNGILNKNNINFFNSIDKNNIFLSGHSSGAHFIYSFILGGPPDINFKVLNNYKIKAISCSGASLRKNIFDFNIERPNIDNNKEYNIRLEENLPSLLHVSGEYDTALWSFDGENCSMKTPYNCFENGKSEINFIYLLYKLNRLPVPFKIDEDGYLIRPDGPVLPIWNENSNSKPSVLKKWADKLGKEYEEYSKERMNDYIINFSDNNSELGQKVLIGMRIKNECHHHLTDYKIEFFNMFINNKSVQDFFEKTKKRLYPYQKQRCNYDNVSKSTCNKKIWCFV